MSEQAAFGKRASFGKLKFYKTLLVQGLLKHEGKALYGEQYSMWQRQASSFVIDSQAPVRCRPVCPSRCLTGRSKCRQQACSQHARLETSSYIWLQGTVVPRIAGLAGYPHTA